MGLCGIGGDVEKIYCQGQHSVSVNHLGVVNVFAVLIQGHDVTLDDSAMGWNAYRNTRLGILFIDAAMRRNDAHNRCFDIGVGGNATVTSTQQGTGWMFHE
ncbi:hypothetical protein AO269_31745 [Pseudomonas putida]|nr:hypothetical protein AO269_31745 [Pseudomonas putida]